MSLTELPSEIQLEILSYLDVRSVLKLASTNRYFNKLPTKSMLGESLLEFGKENHNVLLSHQKHPCYGCMRMCADGEFSDIAWIYFINASDQYNSGSQRHERRCSKCESEGEGKYDRTARPELHENWWRNSFADKTCVLNGNCSGKMRSPKIHARCHQRLQRAAARSMKDFAGRSSRIAQ